MQIVDRDHKSLRWSRALSVTIRNPQTKQLKNQRKITPKGILPASTACNPLEKLWIKINWAPLTFHHVDYAAHIALLDDEAASAVLHRVHAVHDLADLRHLQVFHEVIVQDGGFDDFAGSVNGKNDKRCAVRSCVRLQLIKQGGK